MKIVFTCTSALLFCTSAILFLPFELQAQATRAAAEKDPILAAMLTELDRSKAELQLKGFEKPFYIEYRIDELTAFRTNAEFGASLGSARVHRRAARVTVHVGDYKTNSAGSGDSTAELTALDDDPIALRSALWTATDEAYKEALASYARRQAELKEVETPPQADDFSHEKVVVLLEPVKTLPIDEKDEAAWINSIAEVTGLYRHTKGLKINPQDVHRSTAAFNSYADTSYFVNSEGTITRSTELRFDEDFSIVGQAGDGMNLSRSYYIAGNSLADLDTPADFNLHAIDCINGLADLINAPLVEEEYHGPVLIEADAAAGIMKGLLAGPFAANRPALGTAARTTGAFASSYHARVLPEFFNVVDDPSLSTWNGKGLVGSYTIDQEGVPAQAVELVKEGKLVNYLIGRQPVKDFPNSNGHGRAGLFAEPHPAIGVLKISAANGLTDSELNEKLLEQAKDRGLQNVYVVSAMAGGMKPRLLYKLTPDGKRTLVRGAKLEDIDLRALRSGIVAAGKDLFANNNVGNIAQSVLAPALLFDDATIKRANDKNDKLPYYPPPPD
jgi:predicted Zn-dependent protease